MDQVKTGEFIAQKRKDLGLTQRQLADVLGVSDKTVSKWECGKSMPDYSIMQSICKELHISVNELLAGEILEEADYKNRAEENIMDLMEQQKNSEQKSGRIFISSSIGLLFLVIVFWFIMISGGGFSAFAYLIDMPTFIYLTALEVVVLSILHLHKDFWRGVKAFLFGEKSITDEELKLSIFAMRVAIKSTLLGGVIMTLTGVLIWGFNVMDWMAIGPGLAVSSLGILYASITSLIFYIMKVKMEIRLQKRDEEN